MGMAFNSAGHLFWTHTRPSCSGGQCAISDHKVRLYKLASLLNGHTLIEIPLNRVENSAPLLNHRREATNLYFTSDDTLLLLAHGPDHAGYVLNVDVGKPARPGSTGSAKCDTTGGCMCLPGWQHPDPNTKTCSVYK